jgi:hypothetical protein
MLSHNFSFSKTIPGKGFLLAFVLFCFSSALFSQGTTPQQQAKIDSLMSYISLTMKEGKVPDQRYIDSMNVVIRSMNQQVVVKDSTGKIIPDSIKEITKQSLAGSGLTVPAGKTWRVKRLYVNDGGSYNILVTSVKFDKPFAEGEKLVAPGWTAEAELLGGDQTGFFYIFKIEESDKK